MKFTAVGLLAFAHAFAQCPAGNLDLNQPSWNGWSPGASNTRSQTAEAAKLDAAAIPRLKLKWAFGFPNTTAVYGQPSAAGGRVFVGVDSGYVYSLSATAGCQYWSFKAEAGVRSAVSVGREADGDETVAYFGDQAGNVYALDAATGKQRWKIKADAHPQARITGAAQLYQGRLYVPVASGEERGGGFKI